MRAVLLTLCLLAVPALLTPSASAYYCDPQYPVEHTVTVACDGADAGIDAGVCLLVTAPVNWAAVCGAYATSYLGEALGYALCYGNKGVLPWVGGCT